MKIGMIGLGRMGANMAQRLIESSHEVVGYDPNPKAIQQLSQLGGAGTNSLAKLIEQLPAPRAIWMMVPHEAVDETINELKSLLKSGDTLIDGGNSNYKRSMERAENLEADGISLLDCGTSGGVWGLKEGYSLMIGGDERAVEQLHPIFEALAPSPTTGWGHVGPSGSGHFVKMIHNGIEYGMMQAFAEGFAILDKKSEFELDLHKVAEIWRHGSVVRSWLLDLTSEALKENPELEGITSHVSDSGEGRWTVAEAIDLDVPAPVLTLALLQRLRSRDPDAYYDKLLSAMRNKFGGHSMNQDDD